MKKNKFSQSLKPIVNLFRGRPILAILEVTLRCNSQCGYCDLPLNQGRYEMTRDEIKTIFTGLYRDGLRFVFVQGGEPTLRKDLLQILADLNEIGFALTLITNGTRLSVDFITDLAELPVNISVSLDTLDRERYRRIRGADQLRMVLTGIDRLKRYPHPKYITCIVSEINRDDIMDVVRFCKKSGFIPVVGAYHWDIERYGKVDLTLQYQHQTAADVFAEILESGLVPRGYFRDFIRDNIAWLKGDKLRSCDAGRYSIAIDASGNVAPCLALQHAGNLRDAPLMEILNRFDRSAINSCSAAASCNMMCSRVIGSTLANPLAAAITPRMVTAK